MNIRIKSKLKNKSVEKLTNTTVSATIYRHYKTRKRTLIADIYKSKKTMVQEAGLPKVCHSDEGSWEHPFRRRFVGTPVPTKVRGNTCSDEGSWEYLFSSKKEGDTKVGLHTYPPPTVGHQAINQTKWMIGTDL